MDAAVEEQFDRVVPAPPRRQPVDAEELADRELDAKLLPGLAGRTFAGRLERLDYPSGQLPVGLVRRLREHDPALVVADHHVGDQPGPWQGRVDKADEAGLRLGSRVAGEPGEQHPVVALALDGAVSAEQTLPPQPGPGGDAQGRVVTGVDLRLHPVEAKRAEGVVGRQPDGPGGEAAPLVGLVRRPRELAHRVAQLLDRELADGAVLGEDDEAVQERLRLQGTQAHHTIAQGRVHGIRFGHAGQVIAASRSRQSGRSIRRTRGRSRWRSSWQTWRSGPSTERTGAVGSSG